MTTEEVIEFIGRLDPDACDQAGRIALLIDAARASGEPPPAWPPPAITEAETTTGLRAGDAAAMACREYTRDDECGCSGRRCARSGQIVTWDECRACKAATPEAPP